MDYNFEEFEKIMQQQKEGKDQTSKKGDDRDRRDKDREGRDKDRDKEQKVEPEGKDRQARDKDREKGRDREKSKDRDGSRSKKKDKKKERDSRERYQSVQVRNEERSRSRDKRHRRHRSRDRSDKSSSQRRDHRQRRDRDNKHPELEKDPYYKDRKDIEQVRKADPRKADELQRQLQKRMIIDKKDKEVEMMTEKFKEAKKELEEARRQDLTVLVHSLPLKAKEKDIWSFFAQQGCGKIADIRIIKDPKSNKSKGVSYVEFYTPESIQKALLQSDKPFECNGRVFQGIKVMHSQAEKNRSAAAARQMRIPRAVEPFEQTQQTLRKSTKVVVGGLTERLADIEEERLKELFQPFGHIDYVDIHRDQLTGRCKGFAFIQYTHVEDAKAAVKGMNGIKISGQPIKVSTVSVTQRGDPSAISHDDEYLHSEASRASLMNSMSRDPSGQSNLRRPPISTISTPYLLLTNMFNMEGKTPGFFEDLKKEVHEMCANFGAIEKILVEKNNQGNIWVRFNDTNSAIKAQETLSTQYFDGKKVFCYFVTDQTYVSRVGN